MFSAWFPRSGHSLRMSLKITGVIPEEFENLNTLLMLFHFGLQVLGIAWSDAASAVLGTSKTFPRGSESLSRWRIKKSWSLANLGQWQWLTVERRSVCVCVCLIQKEKLLSVGQGCQVIYNLFVITDCLWQLVSHLGLLCWLGLHFYILQKNFCCGKSGLCPVHPGFQDCPSKLKCIHLNTLSGGK